MKLLRFQFSLRTLLIVVTFFCLTVGAYIGRERAIVAERKAWLQKTNDIFVRLFAPENNDLPWMRKMLGDVKVSEILVR